MPMADVLIVDDDPTIRSQYEIVLKRKGFSVKVSRDAGEALEELAKNKPRLLILDILLPGSDGIAFLQTADIASLCPGTKVLIASNVEEPQFSAELAALQIDGY